MGNVIEEMTNIFKNFGVDLQLHKYETADRINQLEIVLATVFKELEHHIHQEISKCKGKEDDTES